MSLLKKRIQRIKASLRLHDLNMAASLLINTIASDDMFKYWSGCCHNNEHVPKILRYLKFIKFEPDIPTAVINFMEGDLRIGVQFFLDYMDGPEDLLFILIHERNHLILRKLYPDVLAPDYPGHLFNFGEDVFINAISRRHLPSMLPERFYNQPMELLLTGKHNGINWDYFKLDKYGTNRIKDAHGSLYRLNYALMEALGEPHITSFNSCGYQQWMALILEWHKKIQERSQKVNPPKKQMDEAPDLNKDGNREAEDLDTDTEHGSNEHNDNDTSPIEDTGDEPFNDDSNTEPSDNSQEEESDGQGSEEEVSESEDHPSQHGDTGEDDLDGDIPIEEPEIEGDKRDIFKENCPSVGNDESDDRHENNKDPSKTDIDNGSTESKEQDQEDIGIDSDLKNIVPLVQDDNAPIGSNTGILEKVDGMIKQPIPNLKPNDPIVQLILSTCDITEFRNQVIIFEGDILEHVEGLIKGILSDRATERSFDGYSVSVPFSITRRDVFALSAGETPVLWQRRVGIERPYIDLYVDVSGSMGKYYGYIPFIYDALKHVMGRIFQFSTRIVEVDHKDLHIYPTGGTSFDIVAKHMIEEQVKCAIIFSDGMAFISNSNMEVLKTQLEHLVYIKIKDNDYRNWEKLATDIILLQKKEVR
jgi:hypothetical protein